MLAKDVMSGGVMSVKADASALEAASLLVNTRVSAMPVLDEQGVMVGIVTEANLLPYTALQLARDKAGTEGIDAAADGLRSRRVTEVMTANVVSVDENAPLDDVIALMIDKHIKRLPVRRGQSIVGIVSRVDVLRVIASQASPLEMSPVGSEDKDLRSRVIAALQGKSWSNAANLDVAVNQGDIHLWGIVASEDEHKAYRLAVESVPGVGRVISHMHVRPMPPLGPAI